MAAGQTSAGGGGGAELKSAVLDYDSFYASTQAGTGYSFLRVTLPEQCSKLIAFSARDDENGYFMVYPGFNFRNGAATTEGAAFIYSGTFDELAVEISEDKVTFIGSPDFMSENNSYLWRSDFSSGICYYE